MGMVLNGFSISLVSVMSLLLGCSSSSSDEVIVNTKTIQAALDELNAPGVLSSSGISGIMARVSDTDGNGLVLARSGVAELGSEEPLNYDGYFRMGSNTKPFVSVVMLQLVGEGKLTLDDTVDQWLPGVLSGNGYDGKKVTVRQLLQHTSGIFNYTGNLDWLNSEEAFLEHRLDHVEPEEMVALGLKTEEFFPPGKGWQYSNTNYMLAGMIIERVTGNDWGTEVKSRILDPLGLQHTFEPGDEPELPAPHATGYEQFTKGGKLVDVTAMNNTWAGAAGSLVTTLEDLTKFWRSLTQGLLLKPEQLAQMHEMVLADDYANHVFQQVWPGMRYGLGVMWVPTSCGGGYWSHGGDTQGYATRNATSEDGTRVVVLSLSTEPSSEEQVDPILAENKLFDKIMCADRIEQ